jgi:hypothetical protein
VRRVDEAIAEMSTKPTLVAVVVSIVVILVMLRWFLPGPQMGLNPDGPLVENGVAVIVACGEKRGFIEAVGNAPDPQMGTWSRERLGGGFGAFADRVYDV